ncbi:Zinc finger BED domain-containing protein 1 [Merluccius polli]|uniref:Zinc finger BED domain-containing protein 1 n=1 Tax=Merluccius polli TaxID=89951 RepID=A0AA47NMQ7_MERPO|nr:Zinc finger BED domain-containing protein 1 [Merluccius polli]KAK0137405.1 Zinc finger BED domain-containing protein 1 [Merluccius polli]
MAEAGEQSSENAEETLVTKINSTSAISQYFGFKPEDDLQIQVLCRTCRAIVATSRGNTTNLHHHLLHHHNELHEQFKASQSRAQTPSSKFTRPSLRQQSIAQSFVSATPYEKSSKRHIEITKAITHFLAKDMMPINTVTRFGFLSLVHILDRRYEVPSRNYFSDVAIPNLYEKCRTTVESELGQVEYFACTTDLWSSRTTEPYISLTVHFLDWEFQLKARFKSSYISVEKIQDIKTRVMSAVKDTSQEEGEHSQAKSVDPPINKRAKPSLGSLLKSNPGPTSTTSDMQVEQVVEAEVNSYLLSPTSDSEADPLAWWKLHHFTYPKLSKLAWRYLCIPATSSPSEALQHIRECGNMSACMFETYQS